jgi:DNA-directed RNA polymerase specialized sigma24 family protein
MELMQRTSDGGHDANVGAIRGPNTRKGTRLFQRRGLSRDEAEDLTQEVLVRSVRYLDTLREAAAVECWQTVFGRNPGGN